MRRGPQKSAPLTVAFVAGVTTFTNASVKRSEEDEKSFTLCFLASANIAFASAVLTAKGLSMNTGLPKGAIFANCPGCVRPSREVSRIASHAWATASGLSTIVTPNFSFSSAV